LPETTGANQAHQDLVPSVEAVLNAGAEAAGPQAAQEHRTMQSAKAPVPAQFCPLCGAPWREGAQTCSKCQYSTFSHVRRKVAGRLFYFTYQQVAITALLLGLGYGAYCLDWNSIWHTIAGVLNYTDKPPSENSQKTVEPKIEKKKIQD